MTNQRLIDLVRYSRADLHEAGLITGEEYAALVDIEGSPALLEGYDVLRAQLTTATDEVKRLYQVVIDADREKDRLRTALTTASEQIAAKDAQVRELLDGGRHQDERIMELSAQLTEVQAERDKMRRLLDRLQRCDQLADCRPCMELVENMLAAPKESAE